MTSFIFYKMSKNPWDDFGFNDSDKSCTNRTGNERNVNTGGFGFFNKNEKSNLSKQMSGKTIISIFILIFLVYLATGIFTIDPEQEAIITRFGKYKNTVGPGLHYALPYPIDTTIKETVTRIRTLKIGSDSATSSTNKDQKKINPYLVQSSDGKNTRLQDGLMLTGNENIIDMHFEVQWKIKDLKLYIFSIKNPVKTIADVSQSVVREIVAKNTLADIITKGRSFIESSAMKHIQEILDQYNSGVEIVAIQMLRADPPSPVIDAFRDVQTARVDKESDVNRAESYARDIIPKAGGNAQKITEDAEAYAVEVVSSANGNAARFNSIYDQYKNSKYITRKRIYIETMENVFEDMDKILIDDRNSNIVQYLPVDFLKNKEKNEESN